jgi:hypothetical protein
MAFVPLVLEEEYDDEDVRKDQMAREEVHKILVKQSNPFLHNSNSKMIN